MKFTFTLFFFSFLFLFINTNIAYSALSSDTDIGTYSITDNCQMSITFSQNLTHAMPSQTAKWHLLKDNGTSYTFLSGITGYQLTYAQFVTPSFGFATTTSQFSITGNISQHLTNASQSAGNYVIYSLIDSVEHQYPFSFNSLNDCVPFDSSFPFNLNYYDTHNTRFLNASTDIASTTPTTFNLSFDLSYFLDLTEINASEESRNLNGIRFQWVHNGQTSSALSFPVTVTQGQATTTFNLSQYYGSFPDGSYSFQIGFTTTGSLTAGFVFPRSIITVNFEVANGVVSSLTTTIPNPIEPRAPFVPNKYNPCSLSNIQGCVANIFISLFVPSQGSLQSVVALVSSSSIPFLANAYTAYAQVQSYVDNPSPVTSSSTFAYSLQIPEAGIDVEMFSVQTMTELMGDSKPVFRGIATVALVLGFLSMIIISIRRMIVVDTLTQEKI